MVPASPASKLASTSSWVSARCMKPPAEVGAAQLASVRTAMQAERGAMDVSVNNRILQLVDVISDAATLNNLNRNGYTYIYIYIYTYVFPCFGLMLYFKSCQKHSSQCDHLDRETPQHTCLGKPIVICRRSGTTSIS